MSKKLMEMSTIEGRVRYLSQFIGGLNGLAARIGISPRQLSNYMGGKLNWPPHRIAALAAATKTDPEWIIHGSGEAPRPERLLGIRMAAIADAKPLGIRQLSAAMNSERATEVRAVIQQVATRISAALQSQADLSALSGTMPEALVEAYTQGLAVPCEAHLEILVDRLRLNKAWLLGS